MQIDYTSRDFAALKEDLINLINVNTGLEWDPTNYSDLGNVLVESFAYMGDIMSHYLDRVANETSIETAIQTSTLLSFANLYGYKSSGPTPATVRITFENVGVANIDIPVGTQVMAPLSYGPFTEAYFETSEAAIAVVPGATITLTATEGKTVNTDRPDQIDTTFNKALPTNLGTSDGSAAQSFFVIDAGVIDSSITVYVGQGNAFTYWQYKDNLLEYGPNDLVFTTLRGADDGINIVFGDGINGAIPSSGQIVSSVYRTSTGVAGNVKSLAITEITFIPGNIDVAASTYLTVTNTAPAYGGANSDNLSQLKSKIKAAISSRGRAVTLDDFAKLALLTPQVGKANAASAVYSSVNLYLQSQDDGSATPGYVQSIIASANGNGTTITYTTTVAHNFAVGNVLNISGCSPVDYNLTGAIITSIPTTTTFTVTNAATGTSASQGYAYSTTPISSWTNVKNKVETYLSDKILVGTTVTVQSPTYVPIYLQPNVVIDSSYRQADVKLSIYKAMLGSEGIFQYNKNTFKRNIPISLISSAIQSIPGVLSTTISRFNINGGSSAADINLLDNQIGFLTANALKFFEDDGTTSTVTGGIA